MLPTTLILDFLERNSSLARDYNKISQPIYGVMIVRI